jgi:hypothetical protein
LEPLVHVDCRDALLSFESGADSEARAGQTPGVSYASLFEIAPNIRPTHTSEQLVH